MDGFTYHGMVEHGRVCSLQHLVCGGESEVVFHKAFQTGSDEFLLFLDGARRRRERVPLFLLGSAVLLLVGLATGGGLAEAFRGRHAGQVERLHNAGTHFLLSSSVRKLLFFL